MVARSYRQNCALAHTVDIVGDRWSLLLIRDLLIQPRRFKDLVASLRGIGTNLLSDRLRALERSGLLERILCDANQKAYALTPAGRALEPAVLGLVRWGLRNAQCNQPEFHHRDDWDLLALKAVFHPERARGLVVAAQFESRDFSGWFAISDGTAEIGLGTLAAADLHFAGTVAEVFTGNRPPHEWLESGNRKLLRRFLAVFVLDP